MGHKMSKGRASIFLAAFVTAISVGRPAQGGGGAQNLSVLDVVKKAALSVVRIEIFDTAGDLVGSGTGFFIAPHQVLTNAHVVDELYSLRVVLNSPKKKVDSQPRLLKYDQDADLALLLVERIDAPPLPRLDPAIQIEIGQPVVVYGNDYEGVALASEGIVRACLDDEIIHSAPSHGGHSGSPVLDMEGRVIGVNSASYYRSGIANMGSAIRLSVIEEFLKKSEAPKTFPLAGESRFWARQWKSISGFFSRVFGGLFDLGATLFSLYLKAASILMLIFLGWKSGGIVKKARRRLRAKQAGSVQRANPIMAYMALFVWLMALIVSIFISIFVLVRITEPGSALDLIRCVVALAISYSISYFARHYYRQNRPGRKGARSEPSALPGTANGAGAPAE